MKLDTMTEINSLPSILEADQYSKKIKRNLNNWRELTLFVYSVLLWKKKAYPWIIFGLTSFLFVELAYYNLSFLTLISLLALCINLLDYFGPLLVSTVWKQDNWTGAEERELEEICKSMAHFFIFVKHLWNTLMELKTNKPNMYYPSALVLSGLCAWIGNYVNNLFLTYLLVLTLLLLPGLSHHGLVQKYYQNGLAVVLQTLRGFSGTKPKIQ